MSDLVSVIVTTRNSDRFINDCLISIKNQSYKDIEIIIVDNNSSDETLRIAKKYTEKIFTKGPERSAQRNLGFRKSLGKWFMYIDSDMILSENLIEACVLNCKKKKIEALYIKETILGNSFVCKVKRFERMFYEATLIDAPRFFSRNIFQILKGFDEKECPFGFEDWDINLRTSDLTKIELLKSKLHIKKEAKNELDSLVYGNLLNEKVYEPCLFHNEIDFEFNFYLTKKDYYMQNVRLYLNKWASDNRVKKQFGFIYRFIFVFFENNKWKKVILKPHYYIFILFTRILLGFVYFKSKFKF